MYANKKKKILSQQAQDFFFLIHIGGNKRNFDPMEFFRQWTKPFDKLIGQEPWKINKNFFARHEKRKRKVDRGNENPFTITSQNLGRKIKRWHS